MTLTADLHRAYPSRAGQSRYGGLALRGTAVAPHPGGDADEQLGQESGRVGGLKRAPWIRRWYYEGNLTLGTAVSLLLHAIYLMHTCFDCPSSFTHPIFCFDCYDFTAPCSLCYNRLGVWGGVRVFLW